MHLLTNTPPSRAACAAAAGRCCRGRRRPQPEIQRLEIIAPAGPGGGYDQSHRATQERAWRAKAWSACRWMNIPVPAARSAWPSS